MPVGPAAACRQPAKIARSLTETSPPTPTRSRAIVLVALAALLAGAAALRIHHLDTESVWLDEAFSVSIARTTLANIVFETGHDVHPPLHYFLLFWWAHLTGGSAWAARLLSVIFSLGTIVAAYAVAARLRTRAAGLLAAALLAFSVFQIEFAQEARMYALLALLATLSMYGFVRLFDSPGRRWFAFYAVATGLMVYVHVYAAFILAAQAASLLVNAVTHRGQTVSVATRWMLAQIAVFVAFLPWLAIFLWQFRSVQHGFWIPEPEWGGIVGPLVTYAGSGTVLAVLAPLAVIGAIRMARAPGAAGRPSPLVVVAPWLLAPIVLPFMLSRIGTPIFLAKYTIAASVPFALLVADGITLLPGLVLRISLLACLGWLSIAPLHKYYDTPRKDGWRAAVPVVETQARPGDLIVFYPYFHEIPFDFYLRRTDLVERAFPLFAPPPPEDGWDRAMERAVGGHRRVWLVTLTGDPTRMAVIDQFRARLTELSQRTIQHVEIRLFAASGP
jgi:4-amino-4-deoxy-L-arabinose transferase-like glycosyltransferase